MLFPTHPLPCRCSAVPVQAEALGRSGQGTTSGRPGCLGVSVHYPSPGVEGSSGAAWAGLKSLACLMLRGPLPGSHSGPPAGGFCGHPGALAGLTLWASGAAMRHAAKRWQHHTTSGQRGRGCRRGPRGVCVPGSGDGVCPLSSKAEWGRQFGWAPWKVWLMWPQLRAMGRSLYSGDLGPGLHPELLSKPPGSFAVSVQDNLGVGPQDPG